MTPRWLKIVGVVFVVWLVWALTAVALREMLNVHFGSPESNAINIALAVVAIVWGWRWIKSVPKPTPRQKP